MTPLGQFTKGYIICAFWASTDESTPNGGEPLDSNYVPADLHAETQQEMERDCKQFFEENIELIDTKKADDRYAEAGHDFWLSRNGHGSGFWDGDWYDVGEELHAAAGNFGEYHLYIDDDGMVHGYKG